jgi:hypothetical protein
MQISVSEDGVLLSKEWLGDAEIVEVSGKVIASLSCQSNSMRLRR